MPCRPERTFLVLPRGNQLAADYILEGSVPRAGQQLCRSEVVPVAAVWPKCSPAKKPGGNASLRLRNAPCLLPHYDSEVV